MAALYDVPLSPFVIRMNQKKNLNLNLLVHFLLTTKYYEISQTKYRYSFLLLTNIHAFAEKVENPQKSVANLV